MSPFYVLRCILRKNPTFEEEISQKTCILYLYRDIILYYITFNENKGIKP